MRKCLSVLALSASIGSGAYAAAQAVPAATSSAPVYNPGPSLPLIDGNYSYSLTASDILETGFGTGTSDFGALSGVFEYVSPSKYRPFSMLFSGGIFVDPYGNQNVTAFDSLTLTQGLVHGRWAMGITDTVSYLPQSPTTGLAGVAGLGDLGLQPLPIGGPPTQTVITYSGTEVTNFVAGNVERALNGKTSISGIGSYGVLDFTNGGGFNTSYISGEAGLNRRLNARNGVGANASYSVISYDGIGTSFVVKGANAEYDHVFTRSLSMNVSGGPQEISGFESLPATAHYLRFAPHPRQTTNPNYVTVAVPAQLNFAATAALSYLRKSYSASLAYSRGVNAGSGVILGGFSDTITGSYSRRLNRDWATSAYASYSRTSGFLNYPPFNAEIIGVQGSRALSRSVSLYASYTLIRQTVPSQAIYQNAFSGTSNTFAVGVTFSPRGKHIGQF